MNGGAPWLPSELSLLETHHRPDAFNKLNTGIFDKDQLRQMVKVEG